MTTCDDTFIGDAAQPPEGVLVATDGVTPTMVDVKAGDAVALVRPPQGGQVVYVALRVRNMNRCSVKMSGRFRDAQSGGEVAFDARSVDLIVGSDGWGRP